MAIEPSERIRRDLERVVGDETVTFLMDRPVGGWSHLVTNESLDLRLRVLQSELNVMEHRLGERMTELSDSVDRRLRAQTWAMISALLAVVATVVSTSAF